MDERAISFGSFRLLPSQRLLLEGDQPVRLGSRALDILAALAENAGRVVPKEELIARVWPGIFVEESNLKIQVSALRRALGDGQDGRRYIATIPGRGYNFVAPVRREEPARAPLPQSIATAAAHNLPLAMTRMIGREDAVAALVSRLSRDRLVTIVGPGGIGKTTVALAVAERMIADYEHGVWLIDLAPLADPRLVPSAVATVLGLEVRTENPLPGLVDGLRSKRMLLLLDNCEHVIDAAAGLAAAVLTGVPRINILATSREPLGVAGEREHRLGPLRSPPSSSALTAAEAAAFPAVQLFVERVSAIIEDFALTDANAPLIVEICRRLDCLPLAIEFAAPRVEVLGLEGLAAGLNHGLPLLTARRRTSMPRHQTIRTVLDWSYGLLSEDEQQFFRGLGIFTGDFTVEATAAVATDASAIPVDAIDRLADLVAKSLVVADVGGVRPRFRLLDTTRAYAIEKLDASDERERFAHPHAEYYRNLFERAEGEAPARPGDEWLADYASEIDNLRTALDWAFSPGGDGSIGVALTAASVPLWIELSSMAECRRHVERALARLSAVTNPVPQQEMRLRAAWGTSLNYTTGPVPETEAAWTRTLELARSLGDSGYQLRALRGLWAHRMNAAEYRSSLALADEFGALAEATGGGPDDLLVADRMAAIIMHYLGDHNAARRRLERPLAHSVAPNSTSQPVRFLIDQRVTVRALLARILWFQGFPDQAASTARLAVAEAEAAGHALSLCHALAQAAATVALYNGDVTSAQALTAVLFDRSVELGLAGWIARSRCFQGTVLIMQGELAPGCDAAAGGA